jgi:outer membrane lipase/esterase
MNKILKQCLAAGALLGSASLGFAKPAQEFSNVYSFGGSFTFPGNSWAASLTEKYGFTYQVNATNFALNNASSYQLTQNNDQLNAYQTNVGSFDSDALYMVYVGPNDAAGDVLILAGPGHVGYTDRLVADVPAADIANIPLIPDFSYNAVAGLFPLTEADVLPRGANVANFVDQLHQNGAKYIVVFNHFNESLRQAVFAAFKDPREIRLGEAGATLFNGAIFNAIQATAPDANVIYIDYKRLVSEVDADHLSYFTLADLGAANYDPATPFFINILADPNRHPHALSQKLTGQYVASVVESPTQVALVRELPLNVGTSVAQRTRGLASSFFLNEGGSKWTIDAVGDFANSRTGSFTKKEVGFKNAKTYSGEVFANYRLNTATVLGLRLNHSYTTLDFVAGKGSAKVTETALSLHGAYKSAEPLFVYGSIGAGMLDYGIERKVALGIATRKHKGTPKGNHYFATVGGGYRYMVKKSHDVALTPFVSATYQNVSMGKYTEGGAIQSTTMSFNMPKRQAVVAEAGATLEAKFKPRSHLAILPSISVSYAYDFKNPINDKVKGKVSDMPKEFAVPAYKVEQSSVNLNGQIVAATDSGLSLTVHGGVKPSSRVKTWNVGLSAGLKL